MKKLSELVIEDFPGVSPERFNEWKQAQIEAGRNMNIALIGYSVLILISIFVFKVSGFVPALLIIVGIPVLSIITTGKANRLTKELGITKGMIKKARQN